MKKKWNWRQQCTQTEKFKIRRSDSHGLGQSDSEATLGTENKTEETEWLFSSCRAVFKGLGQRTKTPPVRRELRALDDRLHDLIVQFRKEASAEMAKRLLRIKHYAIRAYVAMADGRRD
ncbi:MAG: hypothetical protein WAM80_14340 [Candidatus Acidiferrales bacterium]